MIKFNDGNYAIYKNIRYKLSSNTFDNKCKGLVRIVSRDKQSLKEGFFTIESNEYLEYNFYCIKDVPKSEITEAYKIHTYAVYKGLELDIIGSKEDMLTLSTHSLIGYVVSGEQLEYKEKLINLGFHEGQGDKFGMWWDIEVSSDDPDLQIIEKRTELDISKL